MSDISLEFLSRQIDRVLDAQRNLQRDVDMLMRIVLRIDIRIDALRADIKSLWLSQSDLRRRVEALEDRLPR
jgi:hypothetical protein